MEEIDQCLRSAGDYLSAMIGHESAASDAAEQAARSKNFDDQAEAGRRFSRDFAAFITAARTAWNYMFQVADVAGSRIWLDQRLDSNLFKFHRELANQGIHKYGVEFGVRQTIRVEGAATIPMRQTPHGAVPAQPGPHRVNLNVTEFVNMAYHYNPKSLEPDVATLCESVLRQHPNETVVELATRYLDGLRQVFRSAARRGRFAVSVPSPTQPPGPP
jgi:hypothetical protein